eukprot:5182405-Heterocapsa_arctica.AAC.1
MPGWYACAKSSGALPSPISAPHLGTTFKVFSSPLSFMMIMELALLSSINPLSSSFISMSISLSTSLSVLAKALVPSK